MIIPISDHNRDRVVVDDQLRLIIACDDCDHSRKCDY